MGFSLSSVAGTLKHINVRKEGPDDEKVLALDLKLEVIAPASAIQPLVGEADSIVSALYQHTNDGLAPRFLSIATIQFMTQFRNHELTIAGLTFKAVDMGKFSIALRSKGEAAITFQAQLKPRSDEVAILSELMQDEVKVSVVAPPELDFGGIESPSVTDDDDDPLYSAAVAYVTETRRASVSGVQRKLSIGYNRAARLIERMEREGIVSHLFTDGGREVLA